jgi:hypothetical protein
MTGCGALQIEEAGVLEVWGRRHHSLSSALAMSLQIDYGQGKRRILGGELAFSAQLSSIGE